VRGKLKDKFSHRDPTVLELSHKICLFEISYHFAAVTPNLQCIDVFRVVNCDGLKTTTNHGSWSLLPALRN